MLMSVPAGCKSDLDNPRELRFEQDAAGEKAWQSWSSMRPEERGSWKTLPGESKALWRQLGFHEGNWNGEGGVGMEIESWSNMELSEALTFWPSKDRLYLFQVLPLALSPCARGLVRVLP